MASTPRPARTNEARRVAGRDRLRQPRRERASWGQRQRGVPQPLDAVTVLTPPEADPAAQAVTSQEADLLWRSLAALPDTYREPMVLFYRQGESVADVARLLDLEEDTVRQRLSRARSMLRDELATVIERALKRTRPTHAFTIAVVAALPAMKPSSAAAETIARLGAAEVTAAAKGALAGLINTAIIGPAIGLLVGLIGAKAAALTGRSQLERECIHRYARRMIVFCFAMSIGLVLVLSQVGKSIPASAAGVVGGVLAWVAVLTSVVAWISARMQREVVRIRVATETLDDSTAEHRAPWFRRPSGPWAFESSWRLLGLPLVAIASCGSDPAAFGARRAVGWIALGDIAVSPFVAIGGFALAPFACGAITAGLFSFSFWGAAIGVVAFGSVAIGWCAYGLGAIGWRAAAGGVVAARDYAVGAFASAAEANTTVAHDWFASQWFWAPVELFMHYGHWVLLLIFASLIATAWYRSNDSNRARANEST